MIYKYIKYKYKISRVKNINGNFRRQNREKGD